MNRKIKDALTLGIAAAFVLMFALWGICKSDDAVSESERRPLKQFPTLNVEEVLSGRFQSNFESYTLDQFRCATSSAHSRPCPSAIYLARRTTTASTSRTATPRSSTTRSTRIRSTTRPTASATCTKRISKIRA